MASSSPGTPAAAAPDPALWITWYDLPESGREGYLAWLHQAYIPGQLERPGFLWAAHYACEKNAVYSGAKGRLTHVSDGSVPAGGQFILLFGGRSGFTFTEPMPRAAHAALPAGDRKMLAMRQGERVNIMLEHGRAVGPAAAAYPDGLASSPCIQLGTFNAGPGAGEEENLVHWFSEWRVPSLGRLPGCVRTRKLVSACGWAKHGILYEFESAAARARHFLEYEEKSFPDKAEWSDRMVRTVLHVPGSPHVAQRLFHAVRKAEG